MELLDLFISVPPSVKDRLEQEEHRWVNMMIVIIFTLIPVTHILLFFLVDYNKPNIKLWATFRIGTALVVLSIGLVSFLLRKKHFIVRFNFYLVALLVSLSSSWSMSFVKGYVVQSKWVVVTSAFVLLSIARGLIIPIVWLICIVVLASPLWAGYTNTKVLITDTLFSCLLIVVGFAMKRIWIQSKVNHFLRNDAIQESIEKQLEFDREIKRFISPVLVRRIEEKTASGQSLVMALDDVLMRKKSMVAVVFTDIRNFSVRSVDTDFVEKELIPSSSKIIDSAEQNMGVAKQIGDAVFIYYSLEDPEEGVLRAFKDAVVGCVQEKRRVIALGREKPERFFSLTYGPALVGNMASFHHREATVIGSPANLAARIDTLTKESRFNSLVCDGEKIALSEEATNVIKTFHDDLEFLKVSLNELDLTMKSFPDERFVYLFSTTSKNIEVLNEVLSENKLEIIIC